jgi:hypothetical protein
VGGVCIRRAHSAQYDESADDVALSGYYAQRKIPFTHEGLVGAQACEGDESTRLNPSSAKPQYLPAFMPDRAGIG